MEREDSTPWTPESVHDFMHAKVVVADDMTFVGSFNLSRSGERNAENVLEIRDRGSPTGSPRSSTRSGRAIPWRPCQPDRRVATMTIDDVLDAELAAGRLGPDAFVEGEPSSSCARHLG